MSGSTYILDCSLTLVKVFSEKVVKNLIFERISELCAANGISIAQLEKKARLGNATVRGWKDSSPTVSNLKAVADVLGVTIDELVKEE